MKTSEFFLLFVNLGVFYSVVKCIDYRIDHSIDQRTFYNVNLTNKHFKRKGLDEAIFCSEPYPIGIHRAFSRAYVTIKSKQKCKIYSNINCSDIEETKKQLNSFFNILVSKWQSSNEECNTIENLPLFKKYCFAVKLQGAFDEPLEVDYFYERVYLFRVMLFCSGFLLFLLSTKLSKNNIFHYFSGVSLGVVGSCLLLFIILWRFIPKKTTALLTLTTCSSMFLFVVKWLYSNFKEFGESFQNWIYGYLIISGLISLAYCYYRGPIADPRAINLVEWSLKLIGLTCIYWGTSYREISLAIIIGFCLVNILYSLNSLENTNLAFLNKFKNRYFPSKRKLLTQEEYNKEAHEFTQKSLEELKQYCKSPECDKWKLKISFLLFYPKNLTPLPTKKTITRISKPDRFAKFISNDDSHLMDDELFAYEKDLLASDLIDDSDDEDENEL